ncbi:MAG: hypothetical protein JEZ10_02265 [Verrucomicrobia bacterium]|nr:hypothetical protein [Verrucomicrobiota bacterium]
MDAKLYLTILAVGLFSIINPASAEKVKLPGFSSLKAPKIINFDNVRSGSVFDPDFPGNFKKKAEAVARLPFVYIQNSQLADHYRREPVLFGFLTLFSSVALGALGFIFHLIHHDSRFY